MSESKHTRLATWISNVKRPRSFFYEPRCAWSVLLRPWSDVFPYRPRIRLIFYYYSLNCVVYTLRFFAREDGRRDLIGMNPPFRCQGREGVNSTGVNGPPFKCQGRGGGGGTGGGFNRPV